MAAESKLTKHITLRDLENPSLEWCVGVPIRKAVNEKDYKTVHVMATLRDNYGNVIHVINMTLEEFKSTTQELISIAEKVQASTGE